MEIFWNGSDITGFVRPIHCLHRDGGGGRSDGLDIAFHQAEHWNRWDPQPDDRIEVKLKGYTTGTMYLNTSIPDRGKFRVHALGVPRAARRRESRSYENMTLRDIMENCAAECGMGWSLWGLDERQRYPYLLREDESAPAFISRLLEMEGAVLKAVNGKLTGIGVVWAQERSAARALYIRADNPGARHIKKWDAEWSGLRVQGINLSAAARDTGVDLFHQPILCSLPATDAITAGRWARGLLLHHNRKAEELTLDMGLSSDMTAMVRADIEGGTKADGAWIVEEAEHDLMNGKSRVKLLRCRTGIV